MSNQVKTTLTEREINIIQCLKKGKTRGETAKEVFVSEPLLTKIIQDMCERLGIASYKSIELVSFAIENNLLEINSKNDNDSGVAVG